MVLDGQEFFTWNVGHVAHETDDVSFYANRHDGLLIEMAGYVIRQGMFAIWPTSSKHLDIWWTKSTPRSNPVHCSSFTLEPCKLWPIKVTES